MHVSFTRFIKQSPHWALAFIAIVLVSFYWFIWAEDRYVSRATVVLESPQVATPELSFSSLMGSGAGNTSSPSKPQTDGSGLSHCQGQGNSERSQGLRSEKC